VSFQCNVIPGNGMHSAYAHACICSMQAILVRCTCVAPQIKEEVERQFATNPSPLKVMHLHFITIYILTGENTNLVLFPDLSPRPPRFRSLPFPSLGLNLFPSHEEGPNGAVPALHGLVASSKQLLLRPRKLKGLHTAERD
jgi:hypothetical protein